MRTKGVGPRGLGVSPFKQTRGAREQSTMQNEDSSASDEFRKSLPDYKDRKMATGAVSPVIDLSDMLTGGPVGGLVKKAALGGLVRSGFMSSVKKGAKKLFGKKRKTLSKKSLDAFLKASPKDPTKTTRLSNYNNSPSSNLRADGFGGTTSVGSRGSYNNVGSN